MELTGIARWINSKLPFQKVLGGVCCNLKEPVKLAGLTWEGRAHCGLDDAKNTARLLTHLENLGFRFSITNSLVEQSVHTPSSLHQPLPVIYCPRHVDSASTYCFCGVKSSKFLIPKPLAWGPLLWMWKLYNHKGCSLSLL
ncbi:hypothetical protein AAC387_Pa03g0026 [Persea americana]